MSQLKWIIAVACLTLLAVDTVSAQPGWRHRYYYGYAPPVYAYPPVVVAPPPAPVVVTPSYTYPAPAYVAPAPVYAAPAYSYGVVGPRGFGMGYAAPGFGVYFGR